MSIEDRDVAVRAAGREQRLHQAAAARQVVNEASDDDHKQQGWFARGRERRKRNKLRASEMSPTDELLVAVADNQPEAEMLCSQLRSAGFACMPRLTSRGGAVSYGGGIGGPHEIVVRSKDAQAAREILQRPG